MVRCFVGERFNNLGGVAEHFLKDSIPLLGVPHSFIFSFVPTGKKFAELPSMKKRSEEAGFDGIIITTKKYGELGKDGIAKKLSYNLDNVTYYDDTADLLDLLHSDQNIKKIWIQPPPDSEFHNDRPKSDNVSTLSIDQYIKTVVHTST